MKINETSEAWYNQTIEQAEKKFDTDRGRGLTRAAYVKSRREHGSNNVYTKKSSELKKLIPTDYAALLLIIALIAAYVFEVPLASGVILFMLIINYAAALFTYYKAQKVLNGMVEYSLPTAKVIRDGKLMLVDMRALVPGDVVCLSAGDVVPADCRLTSTDGLYINESPLTGAKSSVFKDADFTHFTETLSIESQKNMAFATTIVTAGTARGIVVATGDNTAARMLGTAKSLATHENLNILHTLKKYCSVWSLAMLALVFVITVLNLFIPNAEGIFGAFLTGISLAVAAMSELYVAFGYIIVGCGVFGAMKRRRDVNVGALVKNAEKLEDIKRITTLIVPKDGVITSSHSVVDKIYVSRKLYSANDVDRVERIRSAVLAGVISTGIYGAGLASLSEASRKVTPEEEAIIDLAQSLNLYNSDIDRANPIIEHVSAGGASKFETTLTSDTDTRYMAVCRGDAEAILNACEYYVENGRIFKMTTDDRLEFLSVASSLTKSSYRVVAMATGVTGYNNLQRIGSIQSDLTFEGFLAIREPLCMGIAQTISRLKSAGIRVIMATDNFAENDKYIAMSVGIIENESGILSSAKADTMNEDILRTNLPLYNMYVGVSKPQLAKIVKMMQDDGECVGLLGGGIDGALLLKSVDVGFTQSVTISPKAKRSGIDIRSRQTPAYSRIIGRGVFESEALKLISDVVISDADDEGKGGFSAVVSALEYSRTIYQNLLRMVRYLTTSQLTRVFITLGALIIGVNVLTPIQLIFGGLIVDFAAILASAFAKPPHNALFLKDNAEEALKNPLMMNVRATVFALTEALLILLIYPVLNALGFTISPLEFSSAAFITFSVCQLITFASLASEKSIFRPGVRVSASYALFGAGMCIFIAFALLIPSLGAVFGVTPLSLPAIIACIVVPVLTLTLNEVYKIVSGSEKLEDIKRKFPLFHKTR